MQLEKNREVEKLRSSTPKNQIKLNTEDTFYPNKVSTILTSKEFPLSVNAFDNIIEKRNPLTTEGDFIYILNSGNDTEFILGTKNCDNVELNSALILNSIDSKLNKVSVKEGDCFLIPKGLLYSLNNTATILKISSKEMLTMSLSDDNKNNIKMINNVDTSLTPKNLSSAPAVGCDGHSFKTLLDNKDLTIEKLCIHRQLHCSRNEIKNIVLTCTKGNCTIDTVKEKITLNKGESISIPKESHHFIINGNTDILKICFKN